MCQRASSSHEDSHDCGGEVVTVNGCCVCKECGHGGAYASQRPKPNTELPMAPFKDLNNAVCLMHNYFEFKNEEVGEEQKMHKRKRL